MQHRARAAIAVLSTLVSLVAPAAFADDQTVLGSQITVKDPAPGEDATKRSIQVGAKEAASTNTIVGDPTMAGASVSVFLKGTSPSSASYTLSQGTDPNTGKPYWKASSTGFAYSDKNAVHGPISSLKISKSGGGTFQVKMKGSGKLSPVSLLPPQTGTSGCVRIDIGGGDSYHIALPASSEIKKNDAKAFDIRTATVEGVCPSSGPQCGNVLYETFADNSAGWTLEGQWQIGPAVSWDGGGIGDPGADTTPTPDNGVAGVNLGGPASDAGHGNNFLTSPVIDTSGATGTLYLSFQRWLTCDYEPAEGHSVQVFDGSTWQVVWQMFGYPPTFDSAWSEQVYDITAYKNANMQIRFGESSSGQMFQYTAGDWNVDDLKLSDGNCPP